MSSTILRALKGMKLHYKFAWVGGAFVVADPELVSSIPFIKDGITTLLSLTKENIRFHNETIQRDELKQAYKRAIESMDKGETENASK